MSPLHGPSAGADCSQALCVVSGEAWAKFERRLDRLRHLEIFFVCFFVLLSFFFLSFSFLFLSCLLCPILLIYRNAACQWPHKRLIPKSIGHRKRDCASFFVFFYFLVKNSRFTNLKTLFHFMHLEIWTQVPSNGLLDRASHARRMLAPFFTIATSLGMLLCMRMVIDMIE